MIKNSVGILVLGCRGAGKTSFLAGLSLLSRGGGGDGKFQTVPANTATAGLFLDLRRQADMGQWPPATSDTILLEFELTYRGRPFNLLLLDYPGEAFQQAIETLDFADREEIRSHAASADYVLLIADPTQDLSTPINGAPAEDTRRRQDALIQGVGYLFSERRESGKSLPKIAVVMSKDDLLNQSAACSDKTILKANRSFFEQIKGYSRAHTNIPLFPISVCGHREAQGAGSFPADAQPHGYERLFGWMSRREWKKQHRRAIWITGSMVVLAVVLLGSVLFLNYTDSDWLARYLQQTPLEKIPGTLAPRGELSQGPQRALEARAQEVMDDVESQLSHVTEDDAFQRLDVMLAHLADIPQLGQDRRLNGLRESIAGKRESALYASIATAVRGGETQQALKLIGEYQTRFPAGAHREEVDQRAADIAAGERHAARGRVRSVQVVDPGGLARKIDAIRQYLKNFPDDPNKARIEMGLHLAEQLRAADAVRLMMLGCGFGGDAGERKHEIRWAAGASDETALLFKQDESVAVSTFSAPMEIANGWWKPIRIQLWSTPSVLPDSLMASAELSVLQNLQGLDGKQHIPLLTNTRKSPSEEDAYAQRLTHAVTNLYEWRDVKAWVRIQLQIRGPGGWQSVSQSELEAYGRFIVPGDAW